MEKTDRLDSDWALGTAVDANLVNHIKKLEVSGFAPTSEEVRVISYNLIVQRKFVNKILEQKLVWLGDGQDIPKSITIPLDNHGLTVPYKVNAKYVDITPSTPELQRIYKISNGLKASMKPC